jgi:small subunit ribosomal protein S8
VFPGIGAAGRDPRRFEVVLVKGRTLFADRRSLVCEQRIANSERRSKQAADRFSAERGANGRLEEKQTMRLTDPVADMLARIRNAIRARHQKVDIPASKLKTEIARILKEEGYIANFKPTEEEGHKVVRVYLKYGNNNEAVISNLARVSRPGCRVYVRRTEIPRVLGGLGINILTTPKGVMTGRQARKQGLGGELLCEFGKEAIGHQPSAIRRT